MDKNNKMIWVNGNQPGWGRDSLQGYIYQAKSDFDDRIRNLQDQVNSFSVKTNSGRKYWYQWVGRWKYVGAVDKNKDPAAGLKKDIESLRAERKNVSESIRSCIIKPLGKHLLIDTAIFKTHVDKRLPDNIIKLEDVIA